MNAPTLHIKNASLRYGDKVLFLRLNLDLPAGTWVALLGPSGIGKSSLLKMVADLMPEEEKWHAEIETDNDIPLHQQIAYMAQTDLLLPWLSVIDNVLLKLKLRPHTSDVSQREIINAKKILDRVGLSGSYHLYPYQLSGGMRQRAALARTLMEEKPIVLMDEPFSSVDAITRYKLQELAAELLQDKTVFFITHDPTEALRLANQIYVMQGKPATLKKVAELSSPTPRELSSREIIDLQAVLFHELLNAASEA